MGFVDRTSVGACAKASRTNSENCVRQAEWDRGREKGRGVEKDEGLEQ